MAENYQHWSPVAFVGRLDIINGKYGPAIQSPTPEQYSGVDGNNPSMILSIFYDLPQDPSKFEPLKTNSNSGRYNIRLKPVRTPQGVVLEPDHRHDKGVSRFLSERLGLEEKLTGIKRTGVLGIIYEISDAI